MKNITRRKGTFFAVLIITLVFGYISLFGLDLAVIQLKGAGDMRFGIDIRGGVDAAFSPKDLGRAPTEQELENARAVIETRLDQQNILDRDVTLDAAQGYVFVRFPWKTGEVNFDPATAIKELGDMAHLTFREGDSDPDGPICLEGSDVVKTGVERSADGVSGWVVTLELNDNGRKSFAEATSRLVQQRISIYMDDSMISNPTVQTAITDGHAIITGQSTSAEAKKLADQISAGSLPFALEAKTYNAISPQLGSNALEVMVYAGALAFIIIGVLLIFYYRLNGVVAFVALIMQVAGQLIMLTWPQFTITLPGMAGIILSIGMAVDANVIASERIREEIRSGKSIESSVSAGFKNAFSSIFDGNITVLVVAFVMLAFGSGAILSFAYTLLFGIIMNFVAGVLATRLMTMSLVNFKGLRNPRLFLSARSERKEVKVIRFYENRKIYYAISAIIIVGGIVCTALFGVKLDIQFSGGAIFQYSMNEASEPDSDTADNVAADALGGRIFSSQITTDQISGEKHLVLNLAGDTLTESELDALNDALTAAFPDSNLSLETTNNVAPFFGKLFFQRGMTAIILSFLLIIAYVAFSFRKIHGLSAGVFALLALFHDVAVVFFTFVIFRIPIGDSFIAVALTILGYSINDTIVIYDRIRENTLNKVEKTFSGLINRSISQSLTRSINTSAAVFLSVALVYVFAAVNGLESIQSFALPMALGTICGCYSTICISGPTWALWQTYKDRKKGGG